MQLRYVLHPSERATSVVGLPLDIVPDLSSNRLRGADGCGRASLVYTLDVPMYY